MRWENLGEVRNPSGHYSDRVLHQERDADVISTREILAGAFERVAANETERDPLQRYKSHPDELNQMEAGTQAMHMELQQLKAHGSGSVDQILRLQKTHAPCEGGDAAVY